MARAQKKSAKAVLSDAAKALMEEASAFNYQRKAAMAWARGVDHAGDVEVKPTQDFDLNRTIFTTLEGKLPRAVIGAKISKSVFWSDKAIAKIEDAYQAMRSQATIPDVDPRLLDFMVDECDFSMEHADGTFLEHLVFCHDYSALHFPEYSPTVMLLHSILGTGTNTFAMEASKIDALKALLDDFEFIHIEAFPSILRLLANLDLLDELNANLHRLNELKEIEFYRVIDNQPLKMSAEDFWIQLNYQLVHYIDFLPVANWGAYKADPLIQQLDLLSTFLDRAGKRMASVRFEKPSWTNKVVGESQSTVSKLSMFLPAPLTRKMASKAIKQFSAKIGHDLSYRLVWS